MEVNFDPIIIRIGPLTLSWYGLMYFLGFSISYFLVRYQIKRRDFDISKPEVDDLYFYAVLGLIIGARLGYILFITLKCIWIIL